MKIHAGGGTKKTVSLPFAIVLTETERVEIRRLSKVSLSTIWRWSLAMPVEKGNASRLAEAMEKLGIAYVEKPREDTPRPRAST